MASNNKKTLTVALIDPVCGSSKGHNFPTLCKYRGWLMATGPFKVTLFVPAINESQDPPDAQVVRSLPWIFDPYIPVIDRSKRSWLDRLARRFRLTPSSSWHARFWERKVLLLKHIVSIIPVFLSLRAISRRNFDVVFFPGADFYSVAALYWLSRTRTTPVFKRVVFRFMSIMETAEFYEIRRRRFFVYVKKLLRNRMEVVVTAETEKYASLLASRLKTNVTVTGIPVSSSIAPLAKLILPPTSVKKLASLGGARKDKGYFTFLEISTWLQDAGRKNVVFQFQRMDSSSGEFDATYDRELQSRGNLEALAPRVADADLDSYLDASDVVVLAYDTETYSMRGSAILFDSLVHKKPLLGRAGTAFGSTIEIKGLGLTFYDESSFLAASDQLVNLSPEELQRIQERCSQYRNELELNLQQVFGLVGRG